jgi:3-hydroxyacyl-[acyl-carrier-protein] dehydratase
MMASRTHETTVIIPNGHPCLAGHFPGRPIVPAVVLLDRVLSEAERWLGAAPAARYLAQAKFTATLLPDQAARMELTLQGNELRFSLTRGAESVARGVFKIAPGTNV